MTKSEVAQQRKRLEETWSELQAADEALAHGTQDIRRRLRDAFKALLAVDAFLLDIERTFDTPARAEGGAS
jgi:hypothetical protein